MATVIHTSGSARVSVEVSGMEQIDRRLAALPIEIRGTELEKAGTKAISRIEKRAEQLVPQPGYPGDKPGKKPLKQTIATTMRRYGSVLAWLVGPEYPAGAHGHLVEAGTKPHTITAKGNGLADKEQGKFFGKTVEHPGAEPNPFMEPAARDVAPQIESDIIAGLDKAIDKALARG